MSDWTGVQSYHPEDLVISVEAGTRLSRLQEILAEQGQWLPFTVPDGVDDTVGGVISAGVDSPLRGGYGPLIDRVLGLTAVVPAFGAITGGASVVKNVAGYNLPRLFWTTRGSLGIITEVSLKVSPLPEQTALWQWELPQQDVDEHLSRLRALSHGWASISVLRQDGRLILTALWHGPGVALSPVRLRLGTETSMTPPGFIPLAPVVVTGAVAPGLVADLLEAWPAGSLLVELQSGFFVGYLSGNDTLLAYARIVKRNGGALRVLSDERPDVLSPIDDPLWTRLKQEWDPNHCLAPLGGIVDEY